MKKLLIALIIGLFVCGTAYAAQDQKTITLNLGVGSVFELSVGTASLDFGTVAENTSSDPKFTSVTTKTNTGNSWTLKFQHSGMKKGSDEIPSVNIYLEFAKDAATTGTGYYSSTAAFPADSTDTPLYESAAGEIGNFVHNATFSVFVPSLTPSGAYADTVTLTMIET